MATTPTLDLGALDLDMLEERPAPSPSLPVAKPVRARLDLFFEDPDQPRTEIDDAALMAFADEIKARKVQTPINVRPPLPDGRMMVIHGSRRLRASRIAGEPDIPYLIQEDERSFDDYSQVAENQQRENLTPMDLARFIQKRIGKGDSQAFISKQLGIDKAETTCHLTLVNGPAFVIALYSSGRCRTPKYLYELANLAKTNEVAVRAFCETTEQIDRKAIKSLSSFLAESASGVGNTNASAGSEPAGSSQEGQSSGGGTGFGGQGGGLLDAIPGGDKTQKVAKIPSHNPDIEKKGGKPGKPSDPQTIKNPLLLGRVGEQDVMIMLYKRPTTPGLVFVQYEDGSGEAEVEFGTVKNLTLTSSVL